MTRQVAGLLGMLAVLAGCYSPVRPDTSRLAAWTTELRAKQPDDAFGAVYARGKNKLVFVGAAHTEAIDSLTFRMINDAYASYDVDAVIIEGSRRSRGPNNDKLLQWVASQSQREGRQEGGELVASVRGALAEGAAVWGGEPDDTQIRDALAARGVSSEDMLGFYTLRSVPQWLREQKIASPDDPEARTLIDAELAHNRERLELPPTILPSYATWSQWYERTNGKPFGASFVLEETGPLADGGHGSNRIAAAISGVRDAFLLETIADRLNAGDTVLAVFGGSHLMILRPALDAMLGQPCYVGSELSSAAESSNTANRNSRANCDM
jgi:hypothetical protein